VQFSGTITQKIDGKGRVSIPADFRRVLELGDPDHTPEGKRVKMRVVYGDPDRRCLEVYPIAAFNNILERIALLPEGDEDREILELLFVAGSDEVEVDGDGRTILAQKLRDHVGIPRDGGEAVFAGALQTFRIWAPDEFEAERGRKLAAARARLAGGGNPLKLLPKKPES
jgi:MraZ protein